MSVKMALDDTGYDVTESECQECEDGALWVNSFELVCDNCDEVFRKANHGASLQLNNQFDEYLENRGTTETGRYCYDNTERVIMPGGFSEAYYGDGIYGDGEDESTGS